MKTLSNMAFMNITEVLQFADDLLFAQTGHHLGNIQEAVIKGTWDGQTYAQIAEEHHRSESHIRDVGHQLWRIMSQKLGEEVNKSNFSATLKRLHIKSTENICINVGFQGYTQENNHQKQPYYDLTLAPKVSNCYNRKTELQTLSSWINDDNTRLISVLGLSGIGKTYLVKNFVDMNLQNFDIVIWKSMKISPSLDDLINNIISAINSDQRQKYRAPMSDNYSQSMKKSPLNEKYSDKKLIQIWHFFQQQKCLIILDDLQEIFTKNQCAGEYQSQFKNYKDFFTRITSTRNQSHVILISQEKCPEMHSLDMELYPAQCLELTGLNDREFFRKYGLEDEDYWLNLLGLYEGNPAYLQDIANLIKDIFCGKVANFLRENTLILTPEIKFRLTEIWERLSVIEKEIILELSKSDQPLSREDLADILSLSSTDLIGSLQSLYRRYLVKNMAGDKVLYSLSPILREYVKNK